MLSGSTASYHLHVYANTLFILVLNIWPKSPIPVLLLVRILLGFRPLITPPLPIQDHEYSIEIFCLRVTRMTVCPQFLQIVLMAFPSGSL